MDVKDLKIVKSEMSRLQQRIKALEENMSEHKQFSSRVNASPAHTGAVRRASMDLTRALVKLRQY